MHDQAERMRCEAGVDLLGGAGRDAQGVWSFASTRRRDSRYPFAQTIEERRWSPQTQRCDQGAVQPVAGPAPVLPVSIGR